MRPIKDLQDLCKLFDVDKPDELHDRIFTHYDSGPLLNLCYEDGFFLDSEGCGYRTEDDPRTPEFAPHITWSTPGKPNAFIITVVEELTEACISQTFRFGFAFAEELLAYLIASEVWYKDLHTRAMAEGLHHR